MAYKVIKLIPNTLRVEIDVGSLLNEHKFLLDEQWETHLIQENMRLMNEWWEKEEQIDYLKHQNQQLLAALGKKVWEQMSSSAMFQKANRRKWGCK
ncbi:hypothetical protein [Streptococcus suis]|uniref:hypothetical protein n=1 Tax=Streptococcus suis TaxID=1307 RepID=UPI000492A288|nr:hypothetical protein [Streptococcus suis]